MDQEDARGDSGRWFQVNPATVTDDPLLRVSEVAMIFGVQPRTVRLWLKNKKIDGTLTASGQWRIRKSAVKAFANEKYGE